jgi:hypothetical protein
MKRLLITLIVLDAALTHIAVGHLGAREVVLLFVNHAPASMWLVALAKVAGVLYLFKKMKKYAWVKYGLYLIMLTHAAAVTNNIYWLLWRLSLL